MVSYNQKGKGDTKWQDVLILIVATTGKKNGSLTPLATIMTLGLRLVNMMRRIITMKKFDVNIKADTWYCAIEADTEQEAIERALEWFLEYEPDVYCIESKEED